MKLKDYLTWSAEAREYWETAIDNSQNLLWIENNNYNPGPAYSNATVLKATVNQWLDSFETACETYINDFDDSAIKGTLLPLFSYASMKRMQLAITNIDGDVIPDPVGDRVADIFSSLTPQNLTGLNAAWSYDLPDFTTMFTLEGSVDISEEFGYCSLPEFLDKNTCEGGDGIWTGNSYPTDMGTMSQNIVFTTAIAAIPAKATVDAGMWVEFRDSIAPALRDRMLFQTYAQPKMIINPMTQKEMILTTYKLQDILDFYELVIEGVNS